MLSNDLLIVTGALVGSSGAILSYIMCKAMNRSFISVILGGFGTGDGGSAPPRHRPGRRGHPDLLDRDGRTPQGRQVRHHRAGLRMAVAQAQHTVREITALLRDKGCNVRFAIHPVAGRMPGHMNVLLAEAKVPYDIVLEMDEINEDFPDTDVVMVIGANDIRQSGCRGRSQQPDRRHAGAPGLEGQDLDRHEALHGLRYAGVDNPLFYKENNRMLFGDAKKMLDRVLTALNS